MSIQQSATAQAEQRAFEAAARRKFFAEFADAQRAVLKRGCWDYDLLARTAVSYARRAAAIALLYPEMSGRGDYEQWQAYISLIEAQNAEVRGYIDAEASAIRGLIAEADEEGRWEVRAYNVWR